MQAEPGEANQEIWLFDNVQFFGGAQRFVLRLGQVMAGGARGYALRVFCPEESELFSECRRLGIEVHHAPFPDINPPVHPLRIAGAIRRLRRVLRTAPPGTIAVGVGSATHAYLSAAALSLKRRPPVVHLLLEQDTAARTSARVLFRRFGAIVTVGENAARTYRERMGVPVTKVNIFLTPEEYAASSPAPRPGAGSPPVVGVLARLNRGKGVLELVGELGQIPGAWSRLRVAGDHEDAEYVARVHARIAELGLDGSVELLGFVDDEREFIDSVDVLVVPSVGPEGQPLVILEALARGRAAVVRKHALPPEFEGLPAYPYSDPGELRDALAAADRDVSVTQELEKRFGGQQVLDGLVTAAGPARRS
jgi:glycosyltransferase involved in cell wall biosynthesis